MMALDPDRESWRNNIETATVEKMEPKTATVKGIDLIKVFPMETKMWGVPGSLCFPARISIGQNLSVSLTSLIVRAVHPVIGYCLRMYVIIFES